MSDEEAAIRIACVVLKMRVKFMNGWKEVCPRIRLLNTGPTTRRNFPFRDSEGRAGVGTLVGMPGYKEFSADTSDERLKDMGVL